MPVNRRPEDFGTEGSSLSQSARASEGPPITAKWQAAAFSVPVIPGILVYLSVHAHTAGVAGHKNSNIRGRTSPLAVQAPHTTKQDSHELYIAQSCSWWLNRLKLTR